LFRHYHASQRQVGETEIASALSYLAKTGGRNGDCFGTVVPRKDRGELRLLRHYHASQRLEEKVPRDDKGVLLLRRNPNAKIQMTIQIQMP
jgi:hypothetical protein